MVWDSRGYWYQKAAFVRPFSMQCLPFFPIYGIIILNNSDILRQFFVLGVAACPKTLPQRIKGVCYGQV